MSDKNSLDYIVGELAYGFKMADEERREPAVVTEFVSLRDLAERVGPKGWSGLKNLRGLTSKKARMFPSSTCKEAAGSWAWP